MLNTFNTLVHAILENVRSEIRREGHQCSPEVEAILNRALNNLIHQTPVLAKTVQQPSVGVAPTQPRPNQCNGLTKKGTRCSKNKMNGSEYCHAHVGTNGPMTTAQAAFSPRGAVHMHQQQANVATTAIKGMLETRNTHYTNQFNVPSASTMVHSSVTPPPTYSTTPPQVMTPPHQQFTTDQSQVNTSPSGNTFQQMSHQQGQMSSPVHQQFTTDQSQVNTSPSGNTFQQMSHQQGQMSSPVHQQFTTDQSQVNTSPHQQGQMNTSPSGNTFQQMSSPVHQQFTTDQSQMNTSPSGNTFQQMSSPVHQQFTTDQSQVNTSPPVHQQFNTSSDQVETASNASDPYAE